MVSCRFMSIWCLRALNMSACAAYLACKNAVYALAQLARHSPSQPGRSAPPLHVISHSLTCHTWLAMPHTAVVFSICCIVQLQQHDAFCFKSQLAVPHYYLQSDNVMQCAGCRECMQSGLSYLLSMLICCTNRRFGCVQIGWVTGPASLVNAIAKAHQFLVFTVPSNLQRAVAHGLDHESSFFT